MQAPFILNIKAIYSVYMKNLAMASRRRDAYIVNSSG
jgi:hypothetical protein